MQGAALSPGYTSRLLHGWHSQAACPAAARCWEPGSSTHLPGMRPLRPLHGQLRPVFCLNRVPGSYTSTGAHLWATVPSEAQWTPMRTRGPRNRGSSCSLLVTSRHWGILSTAAGQCASSSRACVSMAKATACRTGFAGSSAGQPCSAGLRLAPARERPSSTAVQLNAQPWTAV